MLRGNIDIVTEEAISGWLYADIASVRDRIVLAFVDDRCVGAGRVEHFRQDLADADLADGVLGFEFPIVLPQPHDTTRVTVRLEGSDAVLLQSKSRVVAADQGAAQVEVKSAPRSLSSLQWMRAQGWLEQSEYDFLRYVDQLGVYERSLRQPKQSGGAQQKSLDPAATALSLFQLYYLDDVGLQKHNISSISNIAGLTRDSVALVGFEPLVALWSEERVRIGLIETSHRAAMPLDTNIAAAGVECQVGPDHLLFLNPRCAVEPRGTAAAGGITVFTAVAAG